MDHEHKLAIRRRGLLVFVFLLHCLVPSVGLSYDCVKLAPLLRDTGSNDQNLSSYRRVVISLLDEETRSYKHLQQKLAEAKVTIPVAVLDGVFPVEFEGKKRDDDSQWEDYRRRRKQFLETVDLQQANLSSSYATFQPEALKTIKACFSAPGLHVFADYDESAPNIVNVFFNYIGEPAEATASESLRVMPTGAWTCSASYAKKNGKIGSNLRNESCQRVNDADATVTVVTNRGSGGVNLPNKVMCSYRVEERFLSCPDSQVGKRIEKRQYCSDGKPNFTPWIAAGGQCGAPDCKSTSEVVRAIYKHALEKEPSKGEVEAGRILLASGVTVRNLLKSVISTPEFKAKWYSTPPPGAANLVHPGSEGLVWGGPSHLNPAFNYPAFWLSERVYRIALARPAGGDLSPVSFRIYKRCNHAPVGDSYGRCYGGFLEEIRDSLMDSAEYLQRFGEDVVPFPSDQPNMRVRYVPKVSDCIENDSACR